MIEKVRVLLVEDSQADVRLVKEILFDENITIDLHVARDGEEAMEFLLEKLVSSSRSLPDLVILDLNLPRKDGRQVLAEIKQHPDLCSMPVLVLTTSKSPEDIQNSYKLNANCYVTKPLDLDQFVDLIKAMDEFWFSSVKFPLRAHQ